MAEVKAQLAAAEVARAAAEGEAQRLQAAAAAVEQTREKAEEEANLKLKKLEQELVHTAHTRVRTQRHA